MKRSTESHDLISVGVRNYKARISAGVNAFASDRRFQHDDFPVYSFTSHLEISGFCGYSENRVGHEFVITIYGDRGEARDLSDTLQKYHQKNSKGELQYKKYKDGHWPVYDPPKGIGLLDKERGKNRWHGHVWVLNETVTQMLAMLNSNQPLFMFVHEHKIERARWIRNVSLQTTDPAHE